MCSALCYRCLMESVCLTDCVTESAAQRKRSTREEDKVYLVESRLTREEDRMKTLRLRCCLVKGNETIKQAKKEENRLCHLSEDSLKVLLLNFCT